MHAPAHTSLDRQVLPALPRATAMPPVRLPSSAKQQHDVLVREARLNTSGVARPGTFSPLAHNDVALSTQQISSHSVTLTNAGLLSLTAITVLTDFCSTSAGRKDFHLCSIYTVRIEITGKFEGSCVDKHKQQRHLCYSSASICQLEKRFKSALKPTSCSLRGLPKIESSPVIGPESVQAHPVTLSSRETSSSSLTIPRPQSTTTPAHNSDHFLQLVIFCTNYLEPYEKCAFALLLIVLLVLSYSGNQVLLTIFARSNLVFVLLLPGIMQVLFRHEKGFDERIHDQARPTQNGAGNSSENHNGDQQPGGDPQNTQGNVVTKKRSVSDRKNSRDESNDDESDGNDENPRNPKRQRLHDEKPKPMFACPFYKHNAEQYSSERACVGPGWNTVHRVKEHLYRRHQLPDHQCARCWQPFDLEQGLRRHMRQDPPCTIKNKVPKREGINKDQAKRLKSRKKSSSVMYEADKWFEMYKIIFPDDKRPESPYYERELKSSEPAKAPIATDPKGLGQRIQQEISKIGGVFSNPLYQDAIQAAVNKAVQGGSRRSSPEPAIKDYTISDSAIVGQSYSTLHGIEDNQEMWFAGVGIDHEMPSLGFFETPSADWADEGSPPRRSLEFEFSASNINAGPSYDPNGETIASHPEFPFGAQSSFELQHLPF